jgi:hypothetical protein
MTSFDIPEPQSRSAAHPRLLDTLHRVTRFLSNVSDLPRLLTLIMEEAKGALDAEVASCQLYDEATDELHFEVAMGGNGELVKTVRLKRGQGFGGICLAEGQVLLVSDVRSDRRHGIRADKLTGFHQFTARDSVWRRPVLPCLGATGPPSGAHPLPPFLPRVGGCPRRGKPGRTSRLVRRS